VKLLRARLQTQGALLQLAKLLIAHRHVVKNLQRNVLVALTPGQVNHVEDAVRLLEEQKRVLELVLLYVDEGALIQFEEHDGNFV